MHIDVVTIKLMPLTIYDNIQPVYSFRYEALLHTLWRAISSEHIKILCNRNVMSYTVKLDKLQSKCNRLMYSYHFVIARIKYFPKRIFFIQIMKKKILSFLNCLLSFLKFRFCPKRYRHL